MENKDVYSNTIISEEEGEVILRVFLIYNILSGYLLPQGLSGQPIK